MGDCFVDTAAWVAILSIKTLITSAVQTSTADA